jgi:hypothetical protein
VIDLITERPIRFAEAAGLVPSRHPGKKLSTMTVWRWATEGVQGIKLESIYIGGSRYTSAEALNRFAAATTAARQGTAPAPAPTPKQRRRKQDAVEAELDAAGIGATAARPKPAKPRTTTAKRGGR